MTIQVVAFDIPPSIQAGLDSGELSRFGGVVRDGLGQIVKHLKEVTVAGPSEDAAGRAASSAKGRWVIVGIGLTVAVGSAITLLAVQKRRRVARCVENYDTSLRAYLEAVRDGSLDADIIDQLIADLDAVKTYADNGSIMVDFTTDESKALVDLVVDYTKQLAAANSLELDEPVDPASAPDAVDTLRRHLEAQRRILTGDA